MVAVLLVYILAGFFVAPPIARPQAANILSETLQRPVEIDKVSINPLTLSATVQGFRLEESNGDNIARFDRLHVNFQLLASPFFRAWTFREISLDNPVLDLVRLESGAINFMQLVPESTEPEPDQPAEIPSLLFQKLAIAGGKIRITDKSREPVYNNTITPVDIELTDIGTRQNQQGRHDLVLFSESGAKLALQGDLVINPLTFEGRLEATGPYLPLAYGYVKHQLNIRIDRGDLDLGLDFAIADTAEQLNVTVDNVTFAIDDVLVSDKQADRDMLSIDRIALDGFRFAWPEKAVSATALSVDAPEVALVRGEDGRFNWQNIAVAQPRNHQPPETAADQGPEAETGTPSGAVPEDTGEETPAPDPETAGETPPPLADWSISLDRFAVNGMRVDFTDRQLAEPASLAVNDISLSLESLSNRSGQTIPASLSASMGETGSLGFRGEVQLFPEWSAGGDLTLSALPLTLFQPYVADAVNARLDSGTLTVASSLSADPEALVSATADIGVEDLRVVTTADDKPLLSWASLNAPKLQFSAKPLSLNTGPVDIAEPYARVTIYEDQSTNFHRLTATGNEPETTGSDQGEGSGPPPETPPPQPEGNSDGASEFALTVARVEIENGTVDFADFSLPIPFQKKLSALNGELVDFVTTGKTRASLELDGQVGEYGVVDVSGRLSPWDFTADTELALDLENVDMPDLEPYSIKFVGRKLARGKMDLDLDYKLEAGKLQGSNDIVLTQFELGEKVPQEGALDLPLGLAVALLKGPDGTIDLDLPVSGDTDNPRFSIGSIVLNAFSNLITKAVTAPFKLLGALVGADSDDFDRVEFDPGEAEIAPPQREKLDQLVDALTQRPQLGLEISGVYAPAADGNALRAQKLDASIEAARLERFGDDSDLPRSRQRLVAMERLFSERFGEEDTAALNQRFPVTEEGSRPDGYRDAVRDRLLETVELEPAALEQLARRRADNIVAELTGDGEIAPERISGGGIRSIEKSRGGSVPLKLEVANLDDG